MLFCEKDSTWRKNLIFAFFWCFSWFRALVLKETRKTWWKVLKKQLQGSRKPARGTKSEVEAFDCDKSANLTPKNVEKVEIWPKRHLKGERTRVWKCKIAVYGIASSVVDPQDTNCNFCSGLRQPGADTVRKTCDFWHFRAEKVHYPKASRAKLIRRERA